MLQQNSIVFARYNSNISIKNKSIQIENKYNSSSISNRKWDDAQNIKLKLYQWVLFYNLVSYSFEKVYSVN